MRSLLSRVPFGVWILLVFLEAIAALCQTAYGDGWILAVAAPIFCAVVAGLTLKPRVPR